VPPPETRYARLQGDRIAYQVLGEGPPDLVLCPGSFGHLDIGWEDPGIALFCRTRASFSRLILVDPEARESLIPSPVIHHLLASENSIACSELVPAVLGWPEIQTLVGENTQLATSAGIDAAPT
jgi:hypothetical protein